MNTNKQFIIVGDGVRHHVIADRPFNAMVKYLNWCADNEVEVPNVDLHVEETTDKGIGTEHGIEVEHD